MDQRLVDRDLVRQGDGIEAARTDDKRSHRRAPCFDRVGCDRVGPTPTTHSYHRQTLNRPARGKRPKDGIIAVSHTRRPFQEGCQSRSLAPVAMSRPPQRRPTLERLAICRYPAYTMSELGQKAKYSLGVDVFRGRDASYLAPPAQIRASPIRAHGSHLGCVTARRDILTKFRMRFSACGYCARPVLC